MKRISWIVIGIALVLLVVFKLYTNKKHINEQKEKGLVETTIKIPVEVDRVALQNTSERINKTGTLSPYKEAIIYAETSGNIEKLFFELGSEVQSNEVIAIIDADKLQLDIQNARAKEHKAKSDLETYTELLAGGATTQEKVNQLQLEYTNAKNTLGQLLEQFSDTKIKAPMHGIISEKNIETGVFVSTGTKIARVLDLDKLKVQVFINERDVYRLQTGDTTRITTDVYPDKEFKGIISFISPEADATHSYMVEVTLANNKELPLKSGTMVYTQFTTGKETSRLLLLKTALLEDTTEAQVYIVNQGKAILRKLNIGKDFGEYVEVLEGLKQGDLVITSGQINLKDQSEVTITNSNKE